MGGAGERGRSWGWGLSSGPRSGAYTLYVLVGLPDLAKNKTKMGLPSKFMCQINSENYLE